MSVGELVRFPTRIRVLDRLGLDGPDRITALNIEIRRVWNAIRILQEEKAALLVEYRKEARRRTELQYGVRLK